MKLPKSFRMEKSLDEKTNQLVEEAKLIPAQNIVSFTVEALLNQYHEVISLESEQDFPEVTPIIDDLLVVCGYNLNEINFEEDKCFEYWTKKNGDYNDLFIRKFNNYIDENDRGSPNHIYAIVDSVFNFRYVYEDWEGLSIPKSPLKLFEKSVELVMGADREVVEAAFTKK